MGRSGKTIVVGAGSAGLCLSNLLAQSGREVVLVERQPRIGGYLSRFTRKGFRFDTGFHFSGGFDITMPQMLKVLRLDTDVQATRMENSVNFASSGIAISFPNSGIEDYAECITAAFPKYASAIREYFRVEKEIIDSTPMFNLLDDIDKFSNPGSAYDAITLDGFMDSLKIDDVNLRCSLGIMAFCHGSLPSETALSHHCRISYGLESNMARVIHSGDALVNGYSREIQNLGIELRLKSFISELRDFSADGTCGTAILSDGSAIPVEDIFFAVHPSQFLPLFPEQFMTAAVRRRISKYSDSCSFFSIYAALDDAIPVRQELHQCISGNNLNRILSPEYNENAIGIMTVDEQYGSKRQKVLTAFRTMHLSEVIRAGGNDLLNGIPNDRYADFKAKTAEDIIEKIYSEYPEYRGHLQLIETASPLTCARYSPPNGSAYGARNKMATSRFFGRLPVRNCYALGHNSLLPGILGTMMGAFILFRQVFGEENYWHLIHSRL